MKKQNSKSTGSTDSTVIGIITPVYNSIKVTESCIGNIIAQDCPQAEHIIVDGASEDGTADAVRRYTEQYSHIRWISEEDRGQSNAMNKGVAMARGRVWVPEY